MQGDDLLALYRTLKEFIEDEARVQREQFLKHITRPLEERVMEERCLDRLRYTGDYDPKRGTFRFVCDGPHGNAACFRPGDRLRLHRGDYESSTLEAQLIRESDRDLELRPENTMTGFRLALKETAADWILDESYFEIHALLLKGLDAAMESEMGRERVLSLFAGTGQLEMDIFDLGDMDSVAAFGEEAGLNESQTEALALATSSQHAHLVQGPPGTGKTFVLARTVAALVERGERVLVSAFTHRAIHHALKGCLRTVRDPKRLAKIGVPIHDPELGKIRQYENWSKCPLKHVEGGIVVGATPFSAYSKRLSGCSLTPWLLMRPAK